MRQSDCLTMLLENDPMSAREISDRAYPGQTDVERYYHTNSVRSALRTLERCRRIRRCGMGKHGTLWEVIP